MIKQIFTFGFGQPFEGYYHVIEAETKDDCRKQMFEKFGNKWSIQYDSEEKAGVKKWGLKELK